ncbi:MAG: hypothetical protein QOE70_5056 [Chthoniobacter sp.]|jgi:hypothetical protein|nr:hypothetical protein [Chthoniobacter sp.]
MSAAKDQPHHAWLHGELAGWVKEGLLTEEAAQILRARHPAMSDADAAREQRARSTHWATLLFGLLGAVLIGGGIILLLAHNWDQMGRPARAMVAFLPLVLSQALAFWMLWSGKGGTGAREAVGTFLALMAGACLALVSQTYNLGGDFAEFMLVWTLLSLPVAYLLRATLPAIWFCAATVIWVCSVVGQRRGEGPWFWPLLALVLPLCWMECRQNRFGPRSVLLGWAVAIAGTIGLGFSGDHPGWRHGWMLGYAGWFAFLYLAGRRWFAEGRTLWHRPLQVVGVLGGAVMALIFTFDWPWHEGLRDGLSFAPGVSTTAWLITYGWPVLALLLWLESFRRLDFAAIVVGGLPLLVAMAMSLSAAGAMQALFNAYVFGTGVTLLVMGVRKHQLGTVNAGLAILSALVMCRFFDSELGFVLRGLVFILLGVGFLVTNLILLRRKGAAP